MENTGTRIYPLFVQIIHTKHTILCFLSLFDSIRSYVLTGPTKYWPVRLYRIMTNNAYYLWFILYLLNKCLPIRYRRIHRQSQRASEQPQLISSSICFACSNAVRSWDGLEFIDCIHIGMNWIGLPLRTVGRSVQLSRGYTYNAVMFVSNWKLVNDVFKRNRLCAHSMHPIFLFIWAIYIKWLNWKLLFHVVYNPFMNLNGSSFESSLELCINSKEIARGETR